MIYFKAACEELPASPENRAVVALSVSDLYHELYNRRTFCGVGGCFCVEVVVGEVSAEAVGGRMRRKEA